MLKTLENYCRDHPCNEPVDDIRKLLVKAKHLDIFKKIIENFIFEEDTKKFVILLHGKSNCGKSKICERIYDIFHCFNFMETNSQFC